MAAGPGGVYRERMTWTDTARNWRPTLLALTGVVAGLSTDEVGRVAGAAGITLLELTAQEASLEDAFMTATRDAVEFRAPASTGADQ